jgi:hypothetical protein
LQQQRQHLYKGAYVETLEGVFQSFGAYRQSYFQAYTGTHVRRILTNASWINELLLDIENKIQIESKVTKGCCVALQLLAKIQDKTVARKLEIEEIEELKKDVNNLKEHLKKEFPTMSHIKCMF